MGIIYEFNSYMQLKLKDILYKYKMKRKRDTLDSICTKFKNCHLEKKKHVDKNKIEINEIDNDDILQHVFDDMKINKIMIDKSTQTEFDLDKIIKQEINKFKQTLNNSYVSLLQDSTQIKNYNNIII